MTSDRLIAGRYRLGDPIGTGAMGIVWRATDVRLRRTVAVKQLLLVPGLTRAQALEAKMRAMREGRIAARLHHQNAVTVFDVAEEDGQPWLVMEFVDAPSLATLMREHGPMDPQEVARIGNRVAAALTAAHDAGIVHRDVKPANILVADNGTVKITDFGISRAVGDVTVTSTGFLAGTPAYLSPELARGEDPEPSSDVFALGSTLYAAVEGAPPFGEGDNPLAMLHAVARAQVPPPARAGALGPVLVELLAAEAGNRPDMRQAQASLGAVADGRAAAESGSGSATTVLPNPAATVAAAAPGSTTPSGEATTVMGGAPAGPANEPTARVPAEPPGPGSEATAIANTPVPNRQPSRRRRRVVVAAMAVAAVLVLAGLVAAALRGGDDRGTSVAEGGPSAANPVPGASSGQPGTPRDASTTVPSTPDRPVTTTPTGPPPPSDPGAFVSGYYGMLPGDINGAWSMLSPAYQAQTGGYDAFVQFWSEFREVRVSDVTQNGATTSATVTYVYPNGRTESEHRWFRVTPSGGQFVIADSQRG